MIADDSFASIVAAVAEGRGIYENIRRFITYLLAGNTAAALVLLAAAIFGVPPPLVPIQLLWINLAIAALPAFALGLEPYDPELMKEGPRSPRERLLGGTTAGLLALEGAVLGGVALAAFLIAWRNGAADLTHARTHAFAVLAVALVVHAFGCRQRMRSIFSVGLLSNPWLPGAVALSGLLIAASVQFPLLGQVFTTVPLDRGEWLRVAALGLLPLPVMETPQGLPAWPPSSLKKVRLRGQGGDEPLPYECMFRRKGGGDPYPTFARLRRRGGVDPRPESTCFYRCRMRQRSAMTIARRSSTAFSIRSFTTR